MTVGTKKFLRSSAALVGAMVGVGIFGLPYAFAQAGFWPSMAMLVLIALATLLIDLMYGEVVLRTHEHHQILGYTRKYLGPIFEDLMFFSAVLMGYVGLLSYIIISGNFLSSILSSFFFFPADYYSILFAVILSLVVMRSLKTISRMELFFSSLFVVVMVLIFFAGFHYISFSNFSLGYFNRSQAGLPYGILLFAFGGLLGVPIQREILSGSENKLKRSIILAMVFTAVLYALFSFAVVGVTGLQTTTDAVSGLYQFIGPSITVIASLFGLIAISTAFLMLASAMIGTFHLDFKVRRSYSWLLTVIPPFVLFMAGIRSFIGIISLAGGVALGLEQILIIFLYERAKRKGDRVPEYSLNVPSWLLYFLILIFTVGIIYFLFIR